jgi:hypothetical protein
LCLFAYSGVFLFCLSCALSSQCCQFFWIFHFVIDLSVFSKVYIMYGLKSMPVIWREWLLFNEHFYFNYIMAWTSYISRRWWGLTRIYLVFILLADWKNSS